MHYKNGREIKVGELVIGATHNSQGKLRIGRITKLMPQQGPCNVQLLIIGDKGDHFVGSENLKSVREYDGKFHTIQIALDYADAKNLYRMDDCYKMMDAVCDHGRHDAPYFPVTME